jgi:hypothetical protein
MAELFSSSTTRILDAMGFAPPSSGVKEDSGGFVLAVFLFQFSNYLKEEQFQCQEGILD